MRVNSGNLVGTSVYKQEWSFHCKLRLQVILIGIWLCCRTCRGERLPTYKTNTEESGGVRWEEKWSETVKAKDLRTSLYCLESANLKPNPTLDFSVTRVINSTTLLFVFCFIPLFVCFVWAAWTKFLSLAYRKYWMIHEVPLVSLSVNRSSLCILTLMGFGTIILAAFSGGSKARVGNCWGSAWRCLGRPPPKRKR